MAELRTRAARTRRSALRAAASAVATAALAGCAGNGDGEDSTRTPAGAGDGTGSGTPDQGTDAESGLDLREANVVGVEFERGDGGYRFDVTLHHDDDGEEGYANWWQVERLDGTRLGRRELLHPHSNQPFTRSETIAVPDDAACVVVRGHDETHGYGGRAVLVSLESGAAAGADQGSDRRSFSNGDCPA